MGLMELLGKRLTAEQLALAKANKDCEVKEGRYYEIIKYRTFPGGIRVEQDIQVDGKPCRSRIRDYTLDNRLMTQCTMYFHEGGLDLKVTTTYDPPGRLFGDTNASWPRQVF